MAIETKRPPVVVVVGHVDHGKTSLLDFIRKSNVVAKEAGGITQSVGAYEISHKNQRITFIDTPGHEAFSKMRVRGAHVADVGILVVAADEGVKQQTKEAIKALNDSETPFVVAITKIDKTNGDVEHAKSELTANGVFLEGFGGNISYQGISSKTGDGIDELLDLIILTSDVEDLKYDEGAKARGFILEAKMENKRGNTVTVILKEGILKRGDLIATVTAKGKIKILEDFLGKAVSELTPSSPAVILGFDELPQIGEEFIAGELTDEELSAVKSFKTLLINSHKGGDEEGKRTIKLIVKADVAGSLEAILDILKSLPIREDQKLVIIKGAVGEISDGDINEALSNGAVILGFRVGANKAAEGLARAKSITILTNEIIYKLVEDVGELFAKAESNEAENELEVLAIFTPGPGKQTIGGRVNRGQMKGKATFNVKRAEKIIGDGKMISLQQNKKVVNVVVAGNECGLVIESNVKIEAGDKILSN